MITSFDALGDPEILLRPAKLRDYGGQVNSGWQIKRKIPALDGARLTQLLGALKEADDWERETLTNKIKEDKNFYRRVITEKKKFDEAVIAVYKKKMEKHDKNKIGALLTRLKHF